MRRCMHACSIHVYMCTYDPQARDVCVDACMHVVYMYICVHMYIYIHTYIHTSEEVWSRKRAKIQQSYYW